ncbi:potassium transporter TrkA [Rhizobium albus]|nr:potassium transporter TrkA [Rhizobium albus]
MSSEQVGIIAILLGMLGCFALERPRIEVTALCGLGLAFLIGIVPAETIFSGLSNPAVLTVIEILIIVQVIGRTPLIEVLAARIQRLGVGKLRITMALCALTAAISVFVNNIGAFVMVLPIALSVARSTGMDPRQLIMPISFAALLGGLGSVIGTPANLLVSNALFEHTGAGFAFFDFAWVGVPVALAGLVVVALWSAPRIARFRIDQAALGSVDRALTTEVSIPSGSTLIGATLRDLQASHEVQIFAVIRDSQHVFGRPDTIRLAAGDLCVLRIAHSRLERMIDAGQVGWTGSIRAQEMAEMVVTPGSLLVGSLPRTAAVFEEFSVTVRAIATRSTRVEGRLSDMRLSVGDILYVEGDRAAILSAVDEAEALLIAPARRSAGPSDGSMMPLVLFAAGIACAVSGLVPPEIAFGGTILAMLIGGHLNLRTALAELDWPILIMLAAMIPLGNAVYETGTADLIATGIIDLLPGTHDLYLSVAMLVVAVIITPFVNNASTAIILAPIALELSARTGAAPEPLLMAVAIGASIDFMTPFGHHNNTLAMSLGGYRFRDFVIAGGPVTATALVLAIFALGVFWL